jgi:hypothetical protein
MHCAALEGEDAEPHELFAALGVLVLEGRVPGATERGYGEGPHCPSLGAKPRAAALPHHCDPNTNLLVSAPTLSYAYIDCVNVFYVLDLHT